MRDDICTIPVSDAFEEREGCPICRMYDMLEQRALDYIMGAAMMEPDVRIETNRLGFCGGHLNKMSNKKGSLQLALMLETHLEEINSKALLKGVKDNKKIEPFIKNCFVCKKVEWGMTRMIETVYLTFERDKDFRELFLSQPIYCLPHYNRLMSGVGKSGLKKYKSEFCTGLNEIVSTALREIQNDLKHYCSMFDYRNSTPDADWGNSKTAISRCIKMLSGENLENR